MFAELALCALFLFCLHALTLAFLVYVLCQFAYRLIDHSLHSRDHPKTDNGG